MRHMGPRLAAIAATFVTLAACGGSAAPTVATDVGISSSEILIGNTNALSGPAAAYGTISNASNAYYTYINNQGGINGRKITYKILDDGYNPANTVTLTKQLVEQDKVFAIFGGLGTQDQTSVRDYMNQQKVPQIFVYTGATPRTTTRSAGFLPTRRSPTSTPRTFSRTTAARRSASCIRTTTMALTI
jgi:branched-chain amino acid transport system substrate-binding protein